MPRIILVTGANRGIGLAITQALATKASDVTICLGCRSILSGNEAMQELRQQGIKSQIETIKLDVTDDDSIKAAVQHMSQTYNKIDVLINNAAVASNSNKDLSDFRQVYNSIFDANITSVGLLTSHFLPLLENSPNARVINISSARASVALQTTGKLPPTASIPYSISKTGLNILTLELDKLYENIRFYCASPGHCRTTFNGFRGTKDPLEGARVVVELALSEEGFESGFWQFEIDAMEAVAW
ncbi:hypothetical protein N7495_000955 [Penicillium taxi]|uniref:uncharacterized protein n=1 Tax=Penicillium taxi TaxID=168475 RepID=UPI002545AE64|nr:uncharacterized protein N7495_000955 [Penicillium taxi]KAJ5908273.1 hypothetical protein N7495_000955 [Penicillium taxi]